MSLHHSLLTRLIETQLGIADRLDIVSDAKQVIIAQYPKLIIDLGCVSEPYRIQLNSDTQPYTAYAPRRIPLSQLRVRLILPFVDQVLAQLSGTQMFSKFDCYNAFLQIPLVPESHHC